jgi:hypothetical protein
MGHSRSSIARLPPLRGPGSPGIDEQAAQLDATIRGLIGVESRITCQSPLRRRRSVSVLIPTEGTPVNTLTTAAIRERLRAAGLFTDPRIGTLHIVDQEELDFAEAVAEDGGPSLLQHSRITSGRVSADPEGELVLSLLSRLDKPVQGA